MDAGNPFFMLLDKTPASDLIPPNRSLITVPSTTTIHKVLTLLSEHNILSCPVLDINNQCLGSVDFLSILKLIASPLSDKPFHSYTAEHLISYSTPLVPYFSENPLSHLLDILSQTHRVALYKRDYELITTLSQSDMLHHLSKILIDVSNQESYTRRYRLPITNLCHTTLQSLKHQFCSPFVLKTTNTISDAIISCKENSYRVIGIVKASNGGIVGDFCIEKLFLLTQLFFQPKEFLQKYKLYHVLDDIKELLDEQEQLLQQNQHTSSKCIHQILSRISLYDWITVINPTNNKQVPCIRHDSTYENAIHLMLSCKTHHLWVVDDNIVPILIVTMTDLLQVLSTTKVNLNNVSDGLSISKLWK